MAAQFKWISENAVCVGLDIGWEFSVGAHTQNVLGLLASSSQIRWR